MGTMMPLHKRALLISTGMLAAFGHGLADEPGDGDDRQKDLAWKKINQSS